MMKIGFSSKLVIGPFFLVLKAFWLGGYAFLIGKLSKLTEPVFRMIDVDEEEKPQSELTVKKITDMWDPLWDPLERGYRTSRPQGVNENHLGFGLDLGLYWT